MLQSQSTIVSILTTFASYDAIRMAEKLVDYYKTYLSVSTIYVWLQKMKTLRR